jgi:hypothetical protein
MGRYMGCGIVVWLILGALAPEFLSLDPRLSVRPHIEVWDSRRLTNLLRLIHELPSLGFPFGIRIKKCFGKVWKRRRRIVRECSRGWLRRTLWSTNLAMQQTVPHQRMVILRWRTKTFWRGSWHRSTWGKGCRRSPLCQHLTEWRHVANGDDHHMWVKLYTPVGLNLFKKPCPQLWTTWRRMLDHREL